MLGSVGFGEIMLIALVALIVFGPHRLPEIARKMGELMAKARNATRDLTSALDTEYGDAAAPIKDLKGEYDATKQQLKDSVATFTDLTTVDPVPMDAGGEPEDAGGEPEDGGREPGAESPEETPGSAIETDPLP